MGNHGNESADVGSKEHYEALMPVWYGRIGYDHEGIVSEKEFKTKAEAEAYALGAYDMKSHSDCCDDSPLEDYWAAASDQESISED